MLILCQGLGWYVCHILVRVHVGVVNYLVGMEILTIVIANVNMLCVSFYDPTYDRTKCAPIVAVDRERRCIFAVYISVEVKQPLLFMGAFRTSDVFNFEG